MTLTALSTVYRARAGAADVTSQRLHFALESTSLKQAPFNRNLALLRTNLNGVSVSCSQDREPLSTAAASERMASPSHADSILGAIERVPGL
jgi:hypothetical protein